MEDWHAGGDHRVRVLAHEVQHHGYVVRGEAPEHILLAPDLSERKAVRVDVLQAAEVA